jgi:hypothetical protein
MFVVEIDEYAWLVPYVENEGEIFPGSSHKSVHERRGW